MVLRCRLQRPLAPASPQLLAVLCAVCAAQPENLIYLSPDPDSPIKITDFGASALPPRLTHCIALAVRAVVAHTRRYCSSLLVCSHGCAGLAKFRSAKQTDSSMTTACGTPGQTHTAP